MTLLPWSPTSIAGKLRLTIGLCFVLIAAILISWLWSLHQVNQARTTIATCTAIERTVLDMDRLLEKARRLHGDFCVQYSRIGLAEAHVQFAQPSIRLVAEAITVSTELKKMLDQSMVAKNLAQHRVDLNLYLASAKRFGDTSLQSIDLITRLAAPERGLEATLNRLLTQLGSTLDDIPAIVDPSRKLQLTLQRYLTLRQRPIMQTAFNTIATLEEQLARPPFSSLPGTPSLHTLLAELKTTGEEMVQVDAEIKNKLNDFNLQNNISQPIARLLIDHAAQEVQAAKEVVNQTVRHAAIALVGCLAFALASGVLISRLITQTITRRIDHLTQCAAQFQQGHLDIKAAEHPADELGQLGQTFNLMSRRIAATMEHLEQTIAERTSQLSASEQRFRSITDQLPHVAIIGINSAREVFFWNRACCQLYGWRDAEAQGQLLEELIVGREQRTAVQQQLISWIEQDRPLAGEMFFGHREGGQVPVFVASLSLRDPAGQQEFYSIQVDLSELKASEQQRITIEAQLQRSRKMEAIGLLAGGVAHDLNNILSGIVSYPDLLLMQLAPDSKLRKPVLAIQESGERAAAVVADLLTVARGVSSEKKSCCLNQLINEHLRSPEHLALLARHPDVRCQSALATALPPILCSPVHIKKSLMNLLTNAAEAIDHGGQISLSTRAEEIQAAAAQSLGIAPGQYVVVEVADSGSGIPEADLEHIFEPFYTRKAMGRSGTGLGLAVVWNTIEDHRGGVQVESSKAGTVFRLYFPAASQPTLPVQEPSGSGLMHGAGQRVLVVDDELLQREIASQCLDTLGYLPQAVSSGEEAVHLLKTQQVDLVLLDMLMGSGINGRQTYERILQHHPGQKALIVSGYAENDEVRQALALGVSAYLQKPYTLEHLSKTVADILASTTEDAAPAA